MFYLFSVLAVLGGASHMCVCLQVCGAWNATSARASVILSQTRTPARAPRSGFPASHHASTQQQQHHKHHHPQQQYCHNYVNYYHLTK